MVEGVQSEPMPGANWVHLGGSDGYLSLSQADGGDYGRHSTATGPPRFIHIGLAVTDLATIALKRCEDIATLSSHEYSPSSSRARGFAPGAELRCNKRTDRVTSRCGM
jgi:hypothetical protein